MHRGGPYWLPPRRAPFGRKESQPWAGVPPAVVRPRWPEDRPARLRRHDPQLRSPLVEPSRHVPWSGIDRKTRAVWFWLSPSMLATLLPAAVNGDLLRWRARGASAVPVG